MDGGMTVFELLGISPGDVITVDNPNTDTGARDVVPLSLSRHGISIRAIDTRYGDIRYIRADWIIFMSDGHTVRLEDFPYVQQKLDEWYYPEFVKGLPKKSRNRQQIKDVSLEEIESECITLKEFLDTVNIENLKVAITGSLPIPRSNAKSLLESKGATVMGNISKQTSFLFMGYTGRHEITSKMARAHSLGVKIIAL